MRPAAFSPRLRECHALAGELGALRPIETTGFAVAADGPRTVADARGLACKVSPGGSVQCVGRQVVRTGERAGTPEVCVAERVGFESLPVVANKELTEFLFRTIRQIRTNTLVETRIEHANGVRRTVQ
jgi:hypothetical protein